MKLKQAKVNIDRDMGGAAEQVFRIKADAKAFRVLSDNLYSEKILAIVRELSCNARDAQIAAGYPDRQFDMHLPTSIDKTFRIRDYGTGLSDEDVMTIYTTYFESTKTNTNDQTGCLGLGSKSPFCYVDTFIVSSYFDGVMRQYTAFINEHGYPHIMKMSETETKQPNGVEIALAAKPSDIAAFQDAARRALKYFDVKPNFVCKTKITFEPTKYISRTEHYAVKPSDRYSSDSGPVLICGGVGYPIDVDQFSGTIKQALESLSLDLFVPLGEIEPAASREQLSYNKTTIDTIIKHVTKAIVDLKSEWQKQIDAAPSAWKAAQVLFEPARKIMNFEKIFGNFQYKGKPVSASFKLSSTDVDWLLAVKKKSKSVIGKESSYFGRSTWKNNIKTWRLREEYGNVKHLTCWIDATPDTKVYVVDCPVTNDTLENRLGTDAVAVYVGDRSKTILSSKKRAEAIYKNNYIDQLSEILGGAPVEYVSTVIPQNAVSTMPRRVLRSDSAYKIEILPNGEIVSFNTLVQIDYSKGGIYVPFMLGKPLAGKANIESKLKQLGKHNRSALDKITIYGIPRRHTESVEKNPKWVSLESYVSDSINALLTPAVLNNFETLLMYDMYNQRVAGDYGRINYLNTLTEVYNQHHSKWELDDQLGEILNHYNQIIKAYDKAHNSRDLLHVFERDAVLQTVKANVDTKRRELDNIINKYYLLFCCDLTARQPYGNSKNYKTAIVEYIKAIKKL